MSCRRVFVESFDDVAVEMDKRGEGGFGAVGIAKMSEGMGTLLQKVGLWDFPDRVRRVAVKVFPMRVYDTFDDDSKTRLYRMRKSVRAEAAALARIHKAVPAAVPELVACLEVVREITKQTRGVVDSSRWVEVEFVLVMEYAGRDLMSVNHLLKPKEREAVGEQLQQIVALLHKAGIVHNDVKPMNIGVKRLREGGVQIKLFDMGGVCHTLSRDAAVPACPTFTFTPGFNNKLLARHVFELSDGDKRRFACMSRVHDWFGVVGTLYVLHHDKAGVFPRYGKLLEMGYDAMVDTFRAAFRDDAVVQAILDLPIRALLRGGVTVRDVCRQIDAIDDMVVKAEGRRGPSPDSVTFV